MRGEVGEGERRGRGGMVLLWPDIKAKDDHLKLRVLHILFHDKQQTYTHMYT